MVQRTALIIQSTNGSVTTICRLCEHHVLADALPSHTQYCKIVTQCKALAACSDATLARQLVKLNGASSASVGPMGSNAGNGQATITCALNFVWWKRRYSARRPLQRLW